MDLPSVSERCSEHPNRLITGAIESGAYSSSGTRVMTAIAVNALLDLTSLISVPHVRDTADPAKRGMDR